jgi:hypothetical protein
LPGAGRQQPDSCYASSRRQSTLLSSGARVARYASAAPGAGVPSRKKPRHLRRGGRARSRANCTSRPHRLATRLARPAPCTQQRRGRALVVGAQPQEGLHLRAVARVRVPAAPVACARITYNLSPPTPPGRSHTPTGTAVTEEQLLSATATSVRVRPRMSPVCMQGSAAMPLSHRPMRGCFAADTTPPTHAPRRTETKWLMHCRTRSARGSGHTAHSWATQHGFGYTLSIRNPCPRSVTAP